MQRSMLFIFLLLMVHTVIACTARPQTEIVTAETVDQIIPVSSAEPDPVLDDAQSLLDLGRQYITGEGVEQDYERAFVLIEQASNKGLAGAHFNLAQFYDKGYVVGKNLAKTETLLNQAAEKGLVEAQLALGRLYSRPKEEVQDYTAARLWLQQAAGQGSTQAMEAIALMCVRGQGGVQSYAQAVEWLQLAAGSGSLGATYNLANYYMDGLGVEQDTEMGMNLLKKSAQLGYGYSIDYLVREAQRNNVDAQDFLCNLVVGPKFDTELWRAYRSTVEE